MSYMCQMYDTPKAEYIHNITWYTYDMHNVYHLYTIWYHIQELPQAPSNSKYRLSYLQENDINVTCTCLKYPILKK